MDIGTSVQKLSMNSISGNAFFRWTESFYIIKLHNLYISWAQIPPNIIKSNLTYTRSILSEIWYWFYSA